jgi:hypothetical protein
MKGAERQKNFWVPSDSSISSSNLTTPVGFPLWSNLLCVTSTSTRASAEPSESMRSLTSWGIGTFSR